ncbi:kinase-like domain-containing protein [Fusarium flagelliforme]|uniref:kinase-like domain-containing protein n=1 Tax=Fusarium flagelliforme TaxID=2675880 RepID=UPI001E8CF516|nr:kinase-like domain-containing protein [Fusarium flagelliforme]KAH7174954.1 kinase-like domain-containing protein [Fusarium flagelliforme]
MESTPSADIDIQNRVQKALKGTSFTTSSLEKLSGGSVNWIYVANLTRPLKDGTLEVLVNHAESYMASKPDFPLPSLRCTVEAETLKILSGMEIPSLSDSYNFITRTPKLYDFDAEGLNQLIQLQPKGIHSKDYAIQNFQSPTPQSLKPQCYALGRALGRWLKDFTEWSAHQIDHRELIAQNDFAQTYALGDFGAVLEDVEKTAAAELEEHDKLRIIHGDFWTGNIVLRNTVIKEASEIPLFVVDWEMSHLSHPSVDFGEMIAEMHALWLYKSIDAGLWMMEGFIDGYGEVSEEFAFRTAVHAGTHLVCVIADDPSWGAENYERVMAVGRDILVHAWDKDTDWFLKGDLEGLF